MDDDELLARFSGLRIALAYAIRAASRSPADLGHHRDTLLEIERLIPASAHWGVRDELDGVIVALTRLPVRDPSHGHVEVPPRTPASSAQPDHDPLPDLLR